MKCLHSFLAVFLIICSTLNAKISVNLPYKDVSVQNSRGVAEFEAYELFGEPGQPLLPVYTCAVLLPPDADLSTVSFSIKGLMEKMIGNYMVKPALPPMSIQGEFWPKNRSIVDGKDIGVYTQNALYPKEHVEITSLGKLNCFKVVSVRINLARYNPVTKELVKMRTGELVVDFKSESNYNRSNNRSLKIPLSNMKRVKKHVVNYDEFGRLYQADFNFAQESKLVIITSSAIESGSTKMKDFVDSKTKRGIDAQIVTESEWGSGATGIRNWLKDNYQTLGIEYVLIIGNSSGDVPMMTMDSKNADYPYSQLTGDPKDDKLMEVHMGRIPVYSNNMTDLDNILAKTIAYESASSTEIAWRKNILLGAGGYSSGSKGDKVFEGVHNNCVVTTPPWSSYRIYGTAYGQPEGDPDKIGISTTIFTDQWKNNKYGLVDWATHGSATSAQYVFGSSSTTQVGNDYPAFVLCGSCSNASISNSNNLSYAILKNCGMGAIGGTTLTYYGGNFLTSGSDEGWAYKFGKYMISDSMTAGECITALRELDPGYGWLNRIPYVLYGDPTVGITTYMRSQFISVSNPHVGDEFIVGTKVDITWSSNIEEKVTLSLVKGTTVVGPIAENIDNTGLHSWEIPKDTEAGADYKIQIKADTVTSESDVFTIKKKPSITLSTQEISMKLLPSTTGEKNLKVSNKGEGELRYSVALTSGSASLMINEIYVPYSSFADGFELWNRGTDCDLKGYKIEWKDNANTSGSHTFADSYPVKEGETVVLADEQVTGNCVTVGNLAWGNTGDDITELSIAIYDPDGKCVDYVKTKGSTDTPPPGEWDGDGLQTGTERLYRNKNEDGNSGADWSFADGEESINEINAGQTMDGVGQYRLAFSPKEGTVGAVSDIDIKLTFNSEGLENGDYFDTLEVTHDDPDTDSPLLVICKLTVGETSISNTIKSISKANIAWLGNRISYQIPEIMNNKRLSIKLYNAQGKVIRTLVNGRARSGYHTIRLNQSSSGIQEVAAGFYLCRMEAEGFTKTIRLVVR